MFYKIRNYAYNGIQLVFSGYFSQLPPVPNTMYNDEGKYCFESNLFSDAISHKITLDEVIRQKMRHLLKLYKNI